MKIFNEKIQIICNNKKYDFSNMILNKYLKLFADNHQKMNNIDPSDYNTYKFNDEKYLEKMYVRFDEPYDGIIEPDMDIDLSQFQLFYETFPQEERFENRMVIKYLYSYAGYQNIQLEDFINRKITCLAWGRDEIGYAILDVSNYEIYYDYKEKFSVSRKDTIETDGIFSTQNKSLINYPVHLSTFGGVKFPLNILPEGYYANNELANGVLTKIGLSNTVDYLAEEYSVDDLIITSDDKGKYVFSSIDNVGWDGHIYPDYDVYPASDMFPMKKSLKYVIANYDLMVRITNINDENDKQFYKIGSYIIANEINKRSLLNYELSYERSE